MEWWIITTHQQNLILPQGSWTGDGRELFFLPQPCYQVRSRDNRTLMNAIAALILLDSKIQSDQALQIN